MANTLTSLRKTTLLPIMAALSSFLLVSGQVFKCCHLNESISQSVGKAALAVSQLIGQPEAEPPAQAVKTHLGCHGHPPSDESQVKGSQLKGGLQDPEGVQVDAKESCLSESGFALKPFSPSDGFQATLFSDARALVRETSVPSLPRFEKPRPRNKSSPPLYLLTLQILV